LTYQGPLVSVICLCYNQAEFVQEALTSVLIQSYPNIELIVVDDGSTDNSEKVIQQFVIQNPSIQFLPLKQNLGNCKAFNKGLALSKGAFIIDLAADDVLLPDRTTKGLKALEALGPEYGVNFSDAEWIAENGKHLYLHSKRFPHHHIPQGDIYRNLISKFFICPPTMMFRRSVIEYLGGYDENLAYEDFDFWIRSSRKFLYCYTPEVLVKKRVAENSLSSKQSKNLNPQLRSTYLVCKKIFALNRSNEEQRALSRRILYEFKVCVQLLDFTTAFKYVRLWLRNIFKNSTSG
jgi:glycosyltransferase involved in cell wall biosynthesis